MISIDGTILDKIKQKCIYEDGCWVWVGRMNARRPFITVMDNKERRNLTVRRVMYSHKHPTVQLKKTNTIYTTCGNPMCVNPDHLEIGVGAGTEKALTIAGVLKRYKTLLETGEKWSIARASKELNISFVTLKKYLEMYASNSEYWERLWEQL